MATYPTKTGMPKPSIDDILAHLLGARSTDSDQVDCIHRTANAHPRLATADVA